MQIGRISVDGPDGPEARIVVARDEQPDRWIDVRTAQRLRLMHGGATPDAAREIASAVVPGSLTRALESGDALFDAAAAALDSDAAFLDGEPKLIAPIDPPSYRDFMAFEQHFRYSYERRGAPVPEVLYELPVSYVGNAHAMLGPDDEVPWPAYSSQMDFELELGIVICRAGRNINPERAREHILGLTVFNDFSARDIQMREMGGRLGPSKGKHFASAVGPRIVTLDALDPTTLAMRARVNGETWVEASTATIMWSIEELVAWASTGENLPAGALLGTGTVGGGSGMELGRYLQLGDVIELEIEGIGVLRNKIGRDPDSGWRPEPRVPRAQSR